MTLFEIIYNKPMKHWKFYLIEMCQDIILDLKTKWFFYKNPMPKVERTQADYDARTRRCAKLASVYFKIIN